MLDKKTKLWILIGILIIITIVLINFSMKNQEEVIEIGVILPLSGNAAVYGLSAKEGIELALQDLDNKYQLIYEDSQCNSEKAVSASQKLINIDNVKMIIGHICSSAAMAVAPIAEQNKVILLSPGASTPELTNAGDYIFRNRQSISGEVSKVAEVSHNDFNINKMGIMYVNNDYGVGAKNIFKKKFEELNGEILSIESYEQDSTDFRTPLTKIKQVRPEAIFLAGYIKESAIIIKQATELNLETQFFSTMGVEGQELLDVAGPAAEGIIYTAPSFDVKSNESSIREFINKYKVKYGKEPTYIFAATGYDALKILDLGIEKCKTDTNCIKNRLYSIENYPGVSGLTTFDEYGDVNKPVMIKTVKNGQFVPYEE